MSAWIDQIFQAAQVNTGNIVRRSKADVDKYASRDELIAEVRQRGFHMMEVGDPHNGQYVIVCDPAGGINVIC